MRCLVVQTAFLGDAILTLPLARLVRGLEGVTWVGVVAAPAGAEFLRTQRGLDEVLVYDKHGADGGARGVRRITGTLRSRGVDVAFVPHRSFRSALVTALARIPRRVGFDESGGRLLLTDRVSYRAYPHEIERTSSLIRIVGGTLPRGRVPFEIDVPANGAEVVDEALGGLGVPRDAAVVGIAPGSRWPTKRWDPVRFASVADALVDETGAAVVLVGGAGDEEAGEAVAESMRVAPVNLIGRTSIAAWLGLIARVQVLVSNDSAAAHAAAGLRTPVVAVFGPTVPEQGYAPYSDVARVVGGDVDCRPCGRHGGERCRLGTMVCMAEIGVDDVLAPARELLGRA